jgi:hypothetical protein
MWTKVLKNLFIWTFKIHELYEVCHSDSSAYSRTNKGPHGLKDWQGLFSGHEGL